MSCSKRKAGRQYPSASETGRAVTSGTKLSLNDDVFTQDSSLRACESSNFLCNNNGLKDDSRVYSYLLFHSVEQLTVSIFLRDPFLFVSPCSTVTSCSS